MIRWYVSRSGVIRGPFTEPEVFQLIGSRQLVAGDKTMVEGIEGWLPIEHTAPFLLSFGTPVAPAPSAPASPWYEHPAVLIPGLFFCWPVALILIWRHPRLSLNWKLSASALPMLGVALVIATIASVVAH